MGRGEEFWRSAVTLIYALTGASYGYALLGCLADASVAMWHIFFKPLRICFHFSFSPELIDINM